MRDMSAEVFTTFAGIVAAVGVVAINVLMQRALDLDFLGLTLWFIVPAGALIGGLGAASGYYAAARATQTLPSRRMLIEMLAIAFSTWLLMHWVEYATLALSDGSLVSDQVHFWYYLRLRTEHMQLVIENQSHTRPDTTPELGLLGYAHELLQIAGFMLGGLFMWVTLRSHEACTPCSRYARTTKLLERVTSSVFDDVLSRAGIMIPAFADRVVHALGKRRLVGLNLSIATCPSCRRSWIRPAAVGMDGVHPVVKPIVAYDLSAAQAEELYRVRSSAD
jgi:hypothetical protein